MSSSLGLELVSSELISEPCLCLLSPFLLFPGNPTNLKNASVEENFSPSFNKYPGSFNDESDKLLPIFFPASAIISVVVFTFSTSFRFFFLDFLPSPSSSLSSLSSLSSNKFLVAVGELTTLSSSFSTDFTSLLATF